jgi:hypothetical protein
MECVIGVSREINIYSFYRFLRKRKCAKLPNARPGRKISFEIIAFLEKFPAYDFSGVLGRTSKDVSDAKDARMLASTQIAKMSRLAIEDFLRRPTF